MRYAVMHDTHSLGVSRASRWELLSTELSKSGTAKMAAAWNICTCANGGPEEEGPGVRSWGLGDRKTNDQATIAKAMVPEPE
jgi:hypothetical protein